MTNASHTAYITTVQFSNSHPHHIICYQNYPQCLDQQQLHREYWSDSEWALLARKTFSALCTKKLLLQEQRIKILGQTAYDSKGKQSLFPMTFIIWLKCINAVYLAVSKVCSWSLTTGFTSSSEELLSTAPLLMSGFVRCSQKVKYFNTKWHPEKYWWGPRSCS